MEDNDRTGPIREAHMDRRILPVAAVAVLVIVLVALFAWGMANL